MAPSATKLTAGKADGSVKLGTDGFGADFNEHLVWHVVRNEMLWRRQGTHSTRNRAMMRGGGQKPWRQKGTGRARQGSRRSPQWRGGATVFGPTPRSYGGKVNRKEHAAARRQALSLHAGRGTLAVLTDSAFADKPSTKDAAATVKAWDAAANGKLLVVCALEQEVVWKSFRNLADTLVVAVEDLDVADVMWARAVVLTEAAQNKLEGKGA